MPDVYRASYTAAIPDGANVRGDKVTWTDGRGKKREGKLITGRDGSRKVCIEGSAWMCRYRDEHGIQRKVSTGCRTKEGAQHFLYQREIEIERIRLGIVSRDEIQRFESANTKVQSLFEPFAIHQQAKDDTENHIKRTKDKLVRICSECDFDSLESISCDKIEQWIVEKKNNGLSPRTINSYLIAAKTFLNWCVSTERLSANPLARIKKLNESLDKRKERRSLSNEEIARLLDAARERKRRGNRSGEETALIYQTMLGTGLRSNELASIKVHQVDLDRREIILKAKDEKRKRGTRQPFKAPLGEKLKAWISSQNKTPKDFLFVYTVSGIGDSFERDCLAAGIPLKTDDGRSVDVHALRRTYGTMLARAGVPLTTVQRLMRHSSPELTAKLYIDVEPVDFANALKKLDDF